MSIVKERYRRFKVGYETLQKMLGEEQARLANLQSGLMRLRLGLKFQAQEVYDKPVEFTVGKQK